MMQSNYDDFDEFNKIRETEHMGAIWDEILSGLERYWPRFLDTVKNKKSKEASTGIFGEGDTPEFKIHQYFEKTLAKYDNARDQYVDLFDAETLEEYLEDPNSFKQSLSKDIPIISQTLHSPAAELKEWKIAFRLAPPSDLLNVFINIVDFMQEWEAAECMKEFQNSEEIDDLELGELGCDEYLIQQVIGGGIQSNVMHHIDCKRFPIRNRNSLYALYFLSSQKSCGLPSDSSEFLMVGDCSIDEHGFIMMEHNFWYPYDVYWVYADRIYDWLSDKLATMNIDVNKSMKYVYVRAFSDGICSLHSDDIKTMRGHERFEVPM